MMFFDSITSTLMLGVYFSSYSSWGKFYFYVDVEFWNLFFFYTSLNGFKSDFGFVFGVWGYYIIE